MLSEIKCPRKPARTTANFVVLLAAHEHQHRHFESLTMRTGQVSSTNLASATHVEMPRMECSSSVRDFHDTPFALSFVVYETQPFFRFRVRPRHFINNFCASVPYSALAFHNKLFFRQCEGSDYAVAPANDGQLLYWGLM